MNSQTTEYMKKKIEQFDLFKNEIKVLKKLKIDLYEDSESIDGNLELKDAVTSLIDKRIVSIEQQIEKI